MADVTPDAVRQSLKQCMDPEVPINIIDMGLIYGIDVSGSDVNVRMTMTTQGCPLHETMVQDVKRYAKKVPGVANVNVDVVWDPPWTMDKLSDDAKETLKKMGTGVGLSTSYGQISRLVFPAMSISRQVRLLGAVVSTA